MKHIKDNLQERSASILKRISKKLALEIFSQIKKYPEVISV
jgi:hypothetical protein